LLDTLPSQIGAILWLSVCAFAIAKGDRPERLMAGALMIGWLATLTVRSDTDISGAVWMLMGIEVLLLVPLLGLGWKTDRAWPIWAAGFQSITVLVHVVTMIDLRIRAIAYISAYTIGSYGVLICVAIGAFQAWRLRQLMRSRDDAP
jgi:hypothetical protein